MESLESDRQRKNGRVSKPREYKGRCRVSFVEAGPDAIHAAEEDDEYQRLVQEYGEDCGLACFSFFRFDRFHFPTD
jgi:hypothetical protein